MQMNSYLLQLFVLTFLFYASVEALPKLTIDEYFNSSLYASLSLSPNGEHLLVHSKRPAWELNRFDDVLWLYETENGTETLITKDLYPFFKPKWSPSGQWIVYLVGGDDSRTTFAEARHSSKRSEKKDQPPPKFIHLFNIFSNEKVLIEVGNDNPLAIEWAKDDNSFYYVSASSLKEESNVDEAEWKDVIRYRQQKSTDGSTIYRVDIKRKREKMSVKITQITNVGFLIGELLFVPSQNKLVFTSVIAIIEDPNGFEIYSIDLHNVSVITKLTDNEGLDSSLQLSTDGKHVFFLSETFSPHNGRYKNTQNRLNSIDLTTGNIDVWGKDFQGNILGYAIRPQGGVYILGQLGINVNVYIQRSSERYLILQNGWDGTYSGFSSASSPESTSIAFVHSSFQRPSEVYFVKDINGLHRARAITNENELFSQRDLPQAIPYKWINDEDDRTIEGILHYPPGKFQSKNLPLLVLIHGGPTSASLNMLQTDYYSWAPLAASEGWLVFEPNYRGSTGYGDAFLNEIRSQMLTRSGRDILTGVDSLIADGIVDPRRLTVGGYSYGGILTNWLITQTTRFNAALSGAGAVEYVSFWGRMDIPVYIDGLIGGYPWEIPEVYYNNSIMFKLDKVQTPTHIITGAEDVRVPTDQSLILERGLHYLGVPVKLLLFPTEGHSLMMNPWHGKIKLREELKWLQKYGHIPSLARTTT